MTRSGQDTHATTGPDDPSVVRATAAAADVAVLAVRDALAGESTLD